MPAGALPQTPDEANSAPPGPLPVFKTWPPPLFAVKSRQWEKHVATYRTLHVLYDLPASPVLEFETHVAVREHQLKL